MDLTAAWHRYGVRRFRVAERSMSPALEPDDGLITVPFRRARRGWVVVVEHPERPGFVLVKRAVALPGEQVEIADGRLLVDGCAVAEPWARGSTEPEGRWTVPNGSMFLLSDARSSTRADSRTFGPVDQTGARRVMRVLRAGRR